jgi:hypothetical protein
MLEQREKQVLHDECWGKEKSKCCMMNAGAKRKASAA